MSCNEKCESEEICDKLFSNANIEDEYVKMHLQKTASVSAITEEEKRVILKGDQYLPSDRTNHVCLTQEEAEMRLDDKISVTRNLPSLVVTGLTVTIGKSCRHLTNRCSTQDTGCVLTEEIVMEHDLQNESACSPCVLPYSHDKLLSCLALNVCGMLFKIKYPDFVYFVSNYDIIPTSESELDGTDSVDLPEYVAVCKKQRQI